MTQDLSADIEATKRVRDAADFVLKPVLDTFVEANMKKQHGNRWLLYASRSAGSGPADPLDVYGLLKTVLDNWRDVFGQCFDRKTTHKARRLVSTVFEARNEVSHLVAPLKDAEALSYLYAMVELAQLLKAPEPTLAKLKGLYQEQRASGLGEDAPPAPAQGGLDLPPPPISAPVDEVPAGALRPWIEVALPHPDVLANRFRESEFAADLFAVDSGHATEDYATPENFFRITYLTEGLKRVLTSAIERLCGTGGDPVIGLQTAFGGGKTHTMLAVYHLARATDLSVLEGIGPLADRLGVTSSWKKPKVAAFVGSSAGADTSLTIGEGPKVASLWGYLAWRLAGEQGLALVADADRARTNPGSALMLEVLKLAGPCVILLDEVVMYARQLDDARFEAFLSFIQSLTEAAKMAPGCLIVGSLPESNLEAGGERGQAALARLEKVFGRVQSPWLPAAGDETYEIIRRRLFQTLDSEGEKAREATIKAFHDLYKKNAADFPPEAKEGRYLELLRLSYPIHPELFERLSKDWASLPNFQRTRGVLRFMANVVGVLWHQRVADPLIMPARVPIAHERIRGSVLYPLDPAFGAVIEREVDGDGSLPARLESNPGSRVGRMRAATRSARAIFLSSAPLVGQANAGLTMPGLRLSCAEPGDQIATFSEAVKDMTDRAAFFYEEAGRYWFSTKPTLNTLADERARAIEGYKVDEAIEELLRADAAQKGGFARVHAAPDDPTAIDEAQALALVILGPSSPHAGKVTSGTKATEAIVDTLTRCRSGQRKNRNTLVFVAPDEAGLATAREVMRKAMAWAEIVSDDRLQAQITQGQASDARDKAATNKSAAQRAVRTAWSHILYPVKSTTPGQPFDLEHDPITSRERGPLPALVYDKIKGDGIVLERLGAERLALALKDLWPADRPHLPIRELEEWFAAYAYMPKLKDAVVLAAAIRDGVGKLDPAFGYADGWDETANAYRGLAFAKSPPEFFSEGSLLVRREVAAAQVSRSEAGPAQTVPGGGPGAQAPGGADGAGERPQPPYGSDTGAGAERRAPTRFYGSVEIDLTRPVKAFDAIVNAVVLELQRTPGATVTLTLEVEAQAPNGFKEEDVGVVRDNARQLKFKADSTGFSD